MLGLAASVEAVQRARRYPVDVLGAHGTTQNGAIAGRFVERLVRTLESEGGRRSRRWVVSRVMIARASSVRAESCRLVQFRSREVKTNCMSVAVENDLTTAPWMMRDGGRARLCDMIMWGRPDRYEVLTMACLPGANGFAASRDRTAIAARAAVPVSGQGDYASGNGLGAWPVAPRSTASALGRDCGRSDEVTVRRSRRAGRRRCRPLMVLDGMPRRARSSRTQSGARRSASS